MSIILKGVDMPKDIDELRLIINGMSIAIEPTKAIQIPTPHGRLIDENKIDIPSTSVDMFENCGNCNLLDDEQVKEIIHNAPTILEAEE